jgi:hypothetical protein
MQRPHVCLHLVAAAIVCLLPWGAPAADPTLSAAAPTPGWFAYAPAADRFDTNSALDLRWLNEQFAGEHGFIGVKNGAFVHRANGQPVRFWAVNGPPHELRGDDLRRAARLLARYGVNLVRVHGALFDKDGETDPAKIRRAQEIALAMKAEGIYTLFSVYFPLWLTPRPDHPWLKGYDGKKHPFAVLMFNPEFQARHRAWLEALLTTPAEGGRPLLEEPAVFGVEIQNEDSFFFWTFAENNLPDRQLRLLENRFGDWLKRKHGSLQAALSAWNGLGLKRDAPAEGRMAFRPLWNIAHEKTARDVDTAAFLLEIQTQFYRQTYAWLRQLGFKGLIQASNWATASQEVFGPLEKLSYTAGDFIDRHGYFSCHHRGENAEWSIRPGHTYTDRSALRFEAEDPTRSKQFVHPVMDPHYDDKPSIISETTFNRPNRYRSEAPLFFAAYGALQGSDAIIHFALDGVRWSVKPGFWMQPWTLASPAMLGQFPGAALLFRRGLIAPGAVLADLRLNTQELARLQGTPLPQDAAFDELRLKDVPAGLELKPGQRLDPLIHFAGRTHVQFTTEPSATRLVDLGPLVQREAGIVTSSTHELRLDYRKGLLTLNAPKVQGASGALNAAGPIQLRDFDLSSDLDLAHILVVTLDDQPLASSRRFLLQVMTEEKASGFETEPVTPTGRRITNIGRDPWLVRNVQGTVTFKRPDAAQLRATALDLNGYPAEQPTSGPRLELRPATLYYLIER